MKKLTTLATLVLALCGAAASVLACDPAATPTVVGISEWDASRTADGATG